MAHDYAPYRNDPSRSQQFLEILSFCILLTAIPVWISGTGAIFALLYSYMLGIIGLFAWTRRHALTFAIAGIVNTIFLIVDIILYASDSGIGCIPFWPSLTFAGVSQTKPWCGHGLPVYITHGILILLFCMAILMALNVAREHRI